VIIEQPSFDLILWVTGFGALLTLVLLEALIRRSESAGRPNRKGKGGR
jgi:cellobiose-specific phosphotransferase system component IIC